MFTSDGSLIDSNGDISNGTIFIGMPSQVDTARGGDGLRRHRADPGLEMEGRKWME
jgi:hypothetical protein